MDLDKIVKKIRTSELSEDDILKYGRILITEFAKEYHTEQLRLGVVVRQSEQLKCKCTKAKFTRTVDEDFNPLCGKCGKPI